MSRTFQNPAIFYFLIFQKTIFIQFILFKICFEERNYVWFTVSPGLIIYKKIIFSVNIFGIMLN